MTATTSPRINMRLSAEDDAVIRMAADAAGSTVTEFVIGAARRAAERKLAEQRIWRLDATAWDEFSKVIDQEPTDSYRVQLAALFARAAQADDLDLD